MNFKIFLIFFPLCCTCKAHQILKHRFQFHLVKCRRSYSRDNKYTTCRYNSTHVFPDPEIKMHEETCESKIDVFRFMYSDTATSLPKQEAKIHSTTDSNEECWDDVS